MKTRIILALFIFQLYQQNAFSIDAKAEVNKGSITIQGKVQDSNYSDYRIAAVQKDGKSTIAKIADNKKFRFKLNALTAKNMSIQVVSGAGRYVGPVVFPLTDKAATNLSGKRSGNLGNLTISSGFAQAEKGKSVFNTKNTVSFDPVQGTPGSGNIGLVLSSSQSDQGITAFANEGKPGNDDDADGIPNFVDVDDDGDLVLDSSDQNFAEFNGPKPYLFSNLISNIDASLNLNAQSITEGAIDEFVKSNLNIVVGYNSATSGDIVRANVDCLSLPYCGTGGAATIEGVGGINTPDDLPVGSLWSQFDPDSDGFPNLYVYPSKTRAELIIKPNVTTSQIAPGDSLLFKIAFAKKQQTYPLVLSFIFVTVPAATSVSDGTTTTSFTYPGSTNSPGTSSNPISLSSKSVTVNYWRPQRRGIQGAESNSFIDMGNLKYGVDLSVGLGSSSTVVKCQPSDYSALSSTLSLVASKFGDDIDVLFDSKTDGAPDSSQLMSFTLNLDSCITRAGLTSSGQTVVMGLKARDQTNNNASQFISFLLPSN